MKTFSRKIEKEDLSKKNKTVILSKVASDEKPKEVKKEK